jgi:integrase/recombinase XerD
MDKYLVQFIEDMRKRELSNNTVEAYKRDIKKFNDFLSKRKEDAINADMIIYNGLCSDFEKRRTSK